VSPAEAGDQVPSAETEESLAEARAAGVHLIAVPTPFLVGRVNCYLIEDDPLTLVDTGPNSGKSLDELEQALAQLGHRIEDLGLVVITHQHMDHLGLLEIIARRSGAEVAALDVLGPYLRNFGDSAADRTLTALHRPGHSPSDTVFWDEQRRILIAGDHLLARISSNPLISRPLAGPPAGATAVDRPHALVQYMASLRHTREMPAQLVLGGHGPPVRDHAALIDERFRMSERRAGKIRRLLESGPQTAYDLASQMWGNVAVTQAFLTISEVLGHLDLLIADGRAAEDDPGPVTLFEPRAA
jgi:glyoxylase-like metal-dependent hydrolase (beta-lactamase superfamily II)